MKQLTSDAIQALFNGAFELQKRYKKRGKFIARPAILGETVLSIVGGKLETLKTAGTDEFVLRNIEVGSSAEMYIIPKATYEKRYSPLFDNNVVSSKSPTTDLSIFGGGMSPAITYTIDGQTWKVVVPTGEVMAFKYAGETIEFQAPWGEKMICENGDFLANPVGGNPTDVYRIEKETFEQTYGG